MKIRILYCICEIIKATDDRLYSKARMPAHDISVKEGSRSVPDFSLEILFSSLIGLCDTDRMQTLITCTRGRDCFRRYDGGFRPGGHR